MSLLALLCRLNEGQDSLSTSSVDLGTRLPARFPPRVHRTTLGDVLLEPDVQLVSHLERLSG